MISGHPVSRTSASASESASLSPPLPSSMNTTTSATPTAASASLTIRSVIRSCPPSSSPPLSTTTNSRSPYFARAKFRSRVVPGIELVIARPPFAIRLNSVDLPAFARPTSTTAGRPSAAIRRASAPGRFARIASQSELRELARIARPVALDFDDDFQKHLRAENFFELDPRRRADFLERAAAARQSACPCATRDRRPPSRRSS